MLKKKYILIFVLLLVAILIGGAASDKNPEYIVPTELYKLVYPANFGNNFEIPANNPTTKEGVYLGRMLFYEKQLSSNNKISCGTCHQQKLAFTDGKQFSSGVDNQLTERNSMSLANLLWVKNFFWDGRAKGLEEQAKGPLTNPHEMGKSIKEGIKKLEKTKEYPRLFKLVFGTNEINSDRILKAISQFERTLISADSRYDQYLRGTYQPTKQEQNGMDLFMTNANPEKNIRGASCAHCHGTPKMYKELFHNNGLDSVAEDIGRKKITGLANDRGRFRVVTLRNIALTAPYMHDGRFKTLEEVLDHYSEHIQTSKTLSPFLQGISNVPGGKSLQLTKQEKKDLIQFLKMLTDSTFINNPEFSDPKNIKTKNS